MNHFVFLFRSKKRVDYSQFGIQDEDDGIKLLKLSIFLFLLISPIHPSADSFLCLMTVGLHYAFGFTPISASRQPDTAELMTEN